MSAAREARATVSDPEGPEGLISPETSYSTPLIALDAVALDTETTGLDARIARLVQVAALPVVAGRMRSDDRFERLARNPFMLSLLADRCQEGKSFTGSRALLMDDLADRLIARELREGRQPEALTADPRGTLQAATEVLGRLAFAMQARSEGTSLTRAAAARVRLGEPGGVRLTLDEVLDLAIDASVLEVIEGVDQDGTAAHAFAGAQYTNAGKTGTATIPTPGKDTLTNDYYASFVGFAPANHPVLSMIVVVERPVTNIYGGTVAAPVFQQIMRFALTYERVPSS